MYLKNKIDESDIYLLYKMMMKVCYFYFFIFSYRIMFKKVYNMNVKMNFLKWECEVRRNVNKWCVVDRLLVVNVWWSDFMLYLIFIFILVGLCEIGGGYLIWLWFREG